MKTCRTCANQPTCDLWIFIGGLCRSDNIEEGLTKLANACKGYTEPEPVEETAFQKNVRDLFLSYFKGFKEADSWNHLATIKPDLVQKLRTFRNAVLDEATVVAEDVNMNGDHLPFPAQRIVDRIESLKMKEPEDDDE